MAYRLIIYEDNNLLRESLESLIRLNENFELVAAYENATEVIQQLKKYDPDIILMDIDMPGITGIDAVRQIRSLYDRLPVIMLTVFDDDTNVFDALKAGASGYLLKKHISTRLFDAIEEVFSGGAPMSPGIATLVINSFRKPQKSGIYPLTEREKEILSELSSGSSYKIIASNLEISIDTVRTHIKKIYDKLQVHSQTEAVSKAFREKLI